MSGAVQQINAEDVLPGDAIVFLGTPYLIDRIDPYLGVFDFIVGVARSGDHWGMSLEQGMSLDVLRPVQR